MAFVFLVEQSLSPFYSLEGEIVVDTGHTGSHASDTSSIQMNNTMDQV